MRKIVVGLTNNFFDVLQPYWYLIKLILIILVSFIILSLILKLIKRYLLRIVKNKKQASNVAVFLDLLKYVFTFFFILIVVFSYHGNWSELGFIAGLLSVALGWALQKPISGVVAWLIILARRPFTINDRVSISNMKGDVIDIGLTHITLNEVGGTVDGEENSGRIITIPISIIFEKEIINYTKQDDYILDEITATITYESNLEKAEELMKNAVGKVLSDFWRDFPKKVSKNVFTRLRFRESGVDVTVRYMTLATRRNQIATDIQREIHRLVTSTDDVEFAYPHMQVLMKEK